MEGSQPPFCWKIPNHFRGRFLFILLRDSSRVIPDIHFEEWLWIALPRMAPIHPVGRVPTSMWNGSHSSLVEGSNLTLGWRVTSEPWRVANHPFGREVPLMGQVPYLHVEGIPLMGQRVTDTEEGVTVSPRERSEHQTELTLLLAWRVPNPMLGWFHLPYGGGIQPTIHGGGRSTSRGFPTYLMVEGSHS
jgi:hypothetical protein